MNTNVTSTRPRITDAADFGRVVVLYGGRSAERDISLQSGEAVLKALQHSGVDGHGIDVDSDVINRLQQGGFDRAFIALHGRGGEDGVMQSLLQWLEVPYTGSGVAASALAMDKVMSKRIWRSVDLPTPDFVLLDGSQASIDNALALTLPLIVKPAAEGSSIGMSRVEQPEDLAQAWHDAGQLDTHVLAERWVSGMEYTVAIVADKALPAIRVETPHSFYDFDAKYRADSTRYLCPCGLSAEQEQVLQALALRAFNELGCSGWGRVDVFIDDNGHSWLIEANTVPGMTDHSLVPMAAQAAGLSFEQLVWQILETSWVPTAQSVAEASA